MAKTAAACRLTFADELKALAKERSGVDNFTKSELNKFVNNVKSLLSSEGLTPADRHLAQGVNFEQWVDDALYDVLHSRSRIEEAKRLSEAAFKGATKARHIKGAMDTALLSIERTTRMSNHQVGRFLDQAIENETGRIPADTLRLVKKTFDVLMRQRTTLSNLLKEAGSTDTVADGVRLIDTGQLGKGINPQDNSVLQAIGSIFKEHRRLADEYAAGLSPLAGKHARDTLFYTINTTKVGLEPSADALVASFKELDIFDNIKIPKSVKPEEAEAFRKELVKRWYERVKTPMAVTKFRNPRKLSGTMQLEFVDAAGNTDYGAMSKMYRAYGDDGEGIFTSVLRRREKNIADANLYNTVGSDVNKYLDAMKDTGRRIMLDKDPKVAVGKGDAFDAAANRTLDNLRSDRLGGMHTITRGISSFTSGSFTTFSGLRQVSPDLIVPRVANNLALGKGIVESVAISLADYVSMLRRMIHEGADYKAINQMIKNDIGQVEIDQHLLLQGLDEQVQLASGKRGTFEMATKWYAETLSKWSGADRANRITRTKAGAEVGQWLQASFKKSWKDMPENIKKWLQEDGVTEKEWAAWSKAKSENGYTLGKKSFDDLDDATVKAAAREGEPTEAARTRLQYQYQTLFENQMNERVVALTGRDKMSMEGGSYFAQFLQASGLKFIPINLRQTNAIRRSWNKSAGMSQHYMYEWANVSNKAWWKNFGTSAAILGAAIHSGVVLTYMKDLLQGKVGRDFDEELIKDSILESGIGGLAAIVYGNMQFGGVLGDPLSGSIKPAGKIGQELLKEEPNWDRVVTELRKLTGFTNLPANKLLVDWLLKEGFGLIPKEAQSSYRRYLKEEGLEALLDE